MTLGFATRDIAAVIARSEAAGAGILEPAHDVPGMGGMQVAFIAGPEGHLVQLNQAGGR